MEDAMSEPVTPQNAAGLGEFGQFRKVATTRISLFTVPPGTPFETPEGLKAEDEECRVAFDVQGGVYPIRESVFQQSYAPDTLSEKPGLHGNHPRDGYTYSGCPGCEMGRAAEQAKGTLDIARWREIVTEERRRLYRIIEVMDAEESGAWIERTSVLDLLDP